jgi:hypothetical protein
MRDYRVITDPHRTSPTKIARIFESVYNVNELCNLENREG